MITGYKIFHCHYLSYGGYGSYEEKDCIVVAEIKSKALGMACMEYPDTMPAEWEATEISLDHELVYHVDARSK